NELEAVVLEALFDLLHLRVVDAELLNQLGVLPPLAHGTVVQAHLAAHGTLNATREEHTVALRPTGIGAGGFDGDAAAWGQRWRFNLRRGRAGQGKDTAEGHRQGFVEHLHSCGSPAVDDSGTLCAAAGTEN